MTDYNIEDLLAEDTPDKPRFRITDDRAADWAMRKIKELEDDTGFWRGYYAEQIGKVSRANSACIERLTELLAEYFAGVPHRETKTQSYYALPAGKIGYKRQGTQYERDDDVLLPWLKETHPEMVEVFEFPVWRDLKNRIDVLDGNVVDRETGEIVPGVTATIPGDQFFVQLKKEENTDE